MKIRAAKPSDASDLIPLIAQLGYNNLNEAGVKAKINEYSAPDYALLVCEHEERVLGFIALHMFEIFHSPGRAGRITAFCVDETARGKGWGTYLLREAEEFFAGRGCSLVEVTSNNRRTTTHDYYLQKGYANTSLKFVKSLK